MNKEISQKLKIYKILSALTILFGAALLIYMIIVEDEFGALPLFLIILGTAWLIKNQVQIKKQQL